MKKLLIIGPFPPLFSYGGPTKSIKSLYDSFSKTDIQCSVLSPDIHLDGTKLKEVNVSEIDRVLSIVELNHRAASKFKTFSLGMKQRLAIASTLIGNPEVLVLDEPTNGLDPQGIAEIRTIILDLAAAGKTIIIASHILDEVEKICSHVAILKSGNLLGYGPIHTVLNQQEQVFVASSDLNLLKTTLNQLNGIREINQVGNRVYLSLTQGKTTSDLNKALFDKGIIVSEIGIQKANLEANFLELIK